MSRKYKEILDRFADRRLAVVGDSMVDRFLWGRVDRISPEAPVPVVRLEDQTHKLGGAANVAANLRALGAQVVLVTAAGQDATGDLLCTLLAERGITHEGVIQLAGRPTTEKTRIIAHNQQVVRTDVEDDTPLPPEENRRLVDRLDALGPFDGIVLSDYAKGVLNADSLPSFIAGGRRDGAVVVVDPKARDFRHYRGVTSATPNQREAERACALSITDDQTLNEAGNVLLRLTQAESVLITRGEHGMNLFTKAGQHTHLAARATEVYDVTGAGDTVVAAYTLALAAGASFADAASLANHAAGLAVRELGTVTVAAAQLSAAVTN